MTNRRTSSYLLELPPTDTRTAHRQADQLIADLPTEVDASGVATGRAFIRFRTTDDDSALYIALQTVGSQPYRLSVGYGVHQREVARVEETN
jgi:hypothetical protein